MTLDYNQLKIAHNAGAPSSYGSSYEPSVDYATTSNVHSANDHYHQETTVGKCSSLGLSFQQARQSTTGELLPQQKSA